MQARTYFANVLRKLRADGHPTRELRATVRPYLGEADAFDLGQAFYYAGEQWHSGQWSLGYALLCVSEYQPGRSERDCEPDSLAAMLRDDLGAMGGL